MPDPDQLTPDPPITIERLQAVKVEPGDTVIVHLGAPMNSLDHLERARGTVAEALGVEVGRVLFVADGIRLEVWRGAPHTYQPEGPSASASTTRCRHCGELIERTGADPRWHRLTYDHEVASDHCSGQPEPEDGHQPREPRRDVRSPRARG